MDSGSLSYQAKQLEADVNRLLRAFTLDKLSSKERDVLASLKQVLADVRRYTDAYELSENEEERALNAKFARKWAAKVQKYILLASESNIFGAADVAHLSAQAERIIQQLR